MTEREREVRVRRRLSSGPVLANFVRGFRAPGNTVITSGDLGLHPQPGSTSHLVPCLCLCLGQAGGLGKAERSGCVNNETVMSFCSNASSVRF